MSTTHDIIPPDVVRGNHDIPPLPSKSLEPSATRPTSDKDDLQGMIGLLMDRAGPGAIIEIRAPGSNKGTYSGYFGNRELAVAAATNLSGQVPSVYVTLNEVNPELKAPSYNRIQPYAKHTTADSDVLRRLWLPVDADPKRPAGVSSTDDEHNLALQRITEVQTFMGDLGFPDGVLADSGNGGHLLFAIDLLNNAESIRLLDRCLAALEWLRNLPPGQRLTLFRLYQRAIQLAEDAQPEHPELGGRPGTNPLKEEMLPSEGAEL